MRLRMSNNWKNSETQADDLKIKRTILESHLTFPPIQSTTEKHGCSTCLIQIQENEKTEAKDSGTRISAEERYYQLMVILTFVNLISAICHMLHLMR